MFLHFNCCYRMDVDDFKRYFSRMELCHLGPESGHFGRSFRMSDSAKTCWEMTKEEGEWICNVTAGGCRNFDSGLLMLLAFSHPDRSNVSQR